MFILSTACGSAILKKMAVVWGFRIGLGLEKYFAYAHPRILTSVQSNHLYYYSFERNNYALSKMKHMYDQIFNNQCNFCWQQLSFSPTSCSFRSNNIMLWWANDIYRYTILLRIGSSVNFFREKSVHRMPTICFKKFTSHDQWPQFFLSHAILNPSQPGN